MNAIKVSRHICGHFKRNINATLENNVRCYGSGGKFVHVDINPKTGVYTVNFQRPPVNSLSLELVNEFISAMMMVEKDKGRGMIVTSSCPGIFSSGLDLMELYKPNQDRLKAYWTALQDMWLKLYGSAYSTAAAISGHAPGGGCLISVSCDYRVMVKGNYGIGLNETQLGLAVPTWFIDTFRNTLPLRVSEMALITGKLFTVEEALSSGLIDEVASDNAEAVSKAAEYLAKLQNFNPFGIGQTKLTIRYDAISRLQENRENDLRVFMNYINSPETQKGIDLYVQKLKNK